MPIEHAYIHIPFCLRKCGYCSFVSGENIKNKDIYLNTILKEINLRYKNERLKTLYIGGGTPSLSDAEDIDKLLRHFNFVQNAEITLEANPETVSLSKFKDYKSAGINRISTGIQTFDDEILKKIGRGHTKKRAIQAVSDAKQSGFDNISIDLIYGLPGQTFKIFENDLKTAVNLDIKHISSYGLKIEEGSYFYENPPENLPDADMQADMHNFMTCFLKENGFEHYEISNFARFGFKSRHNSAYWQNKEYYGFGVNASGYENGIRYKNISNFNDYINNPLNREEEILLTAEEILENEIFLALRLKEGIDINNINKKFGIDFEKKYSKIIKKYKEAELLELFEGCIRLTEKGFLLSNEVMSEFLDI